ncbi:MAG: hypothetical protein ACTS6J_09275 [Burkholderiales bacterium]
MDAETKDVTAVAAAIRRYLQDHPHAADTLEGIALWWLPGNAGSARLANVQRAIEQLVNRGEVVRKTLRDGTVIYERSKKDDPS